MEPQALGYAAPSTPDQYLTADDYKNNYGNIQGQSPFANGQVVVHNGQNYVRIQSGHDQYGNPTYAMAPYGSVNPNAAAPGAAGAPGAGGAGAAQWPGGAPGSGMLSDPAKIQALAQGGGGGTGAGGVYSTNTYGPTPGALAGANLGGSTAPGSVLGNFIAQMQAQRGQAMNQPMVPGIGGGSAIPVHNVNAFANMLANLKAAPAAPVAAAPAAPGK